jgi:DNA topoisomerase-3
MGNRLFIAEKPKLAKAIAKGIGSYKFDKGAYICDNGDVVIPGYGHMLMLKNPHDYEAKYRRWKEADLPIIPDAFELKISDQDADGSVKAQVNKIGKLLKRKDLTEVVHAGDPDREGQLIVDELLEWFDNKKPVGRIWLASVDDASVTKALNSIKDNNDSFYRNLSLSALARSHADWMVGINVTRALTLRAQDYGVEFAKSLSSGRVQSPTLSLICDRDDLIRNFVSVNYFIPTLEAQGVKALLVMDTEGKGFDENGRLVDKSTAESLIQGVSGDVIVESAKKSTSKKKPPPPHSLSSLQKEASSKLGLSAKEVLDLAQKMYENGELSYPRVNTNYLPEDQFADAPGIVSHLTSISDIARKADTSIRSDAWDDKKVTAHHAIVPTAKKTSASGDSLKLYKIIAEAYLRQFFPPQEVEKLVLTLATKEPSKKQWTASVSRTSFDGWTVTKSISGSSGSVDKSLPAIDKGDVLTIDKVYLDSKKTTPPSHFDDGSLIDAMTNVHRFVTDQEIKALLRENLGIGTDATRASTIETLINRGYVVREGKKLKATKLGFLVNNALPSAIRDPGMTAMWESFLDAISQGKADVDSFEKQIKAATQEMVSIIAETEFPGYEIHLCPTCSSALRRIESKKKKGRFFWGCSGDMDCKLLSDDNGSPGEPFK